MKSVSPGLIKPSSRRACSSMAFGSSRRRRAISRSSAFSVRARSSDRSSAEYSRRAWRSASSPFSPAIASTTISKVRKTNPWRRSLRPLLARVARAGAAGRPSSVGDPSTTGGDFRFCSRSVMGSSYCAWGAVPVRRRGGNPRVRESAPFEDRPARPWLESSRPARAPQGARRLFSPCRCQCVLPPIRGAVYPLMRHNGKTVKRSYSCTLLHQHVFTCKRKNVFTVLRFYGFTVLRFYGRLAVGVRHQPLTSGVDQPRKVGGSALGDGNDQEFGNFIRMQRPDSRFKLRHAA
jgi:hypothetical protein